jgi:hypothetical protein
MNFANIGGMPFLIAFFLAQSVFSLIPALRLRQGFLALLNAGFLALYFRDPVSIALMAGFITSGYGFMALLAGKSVPVDDIVGFLPYTSNFGDSFHLKYEGLVKLSPLVVAIIRRFSNQLATGHE